MLACFFPPEGGAGAQRPFKFAKYLPSLGWEVTVISREIMEGNDDKKLYPLDESLDGVAHSPHPCMIYRVPPRKTDKRLLRIDRYEEWSSAAGNKAAELLSTEKFDFILITMSPFSLVRTIPLIRSVCDVPIVLDFRDPWVFDGWQKQKSYFHWLYYYKVMRSAIRIANGVIVNTPEVGKIFRKQFPWLTSKQLSVIENGYDEDDFLFRNTHANSDSGTFLIVYAGRLLTDVAIPKTGIKSKLKQLVSYSPELIDYSGRTLIHLFSALKIIQKNNPDLFSKLYIKCLGYSSKTDIEYISNLGLDRKVELCGHLPHLESVKQIQYADALFLPLHGMASGNRSRIVPGKAYEYLATGNTIIGCLPEGDARELVLKSKNFVIANPTDPNEIALALIKSEKLYRENISENFPLPWIKNYERKALTIRLDNFISNIVKK